MASVEVAKTVDIGPMVLGTPGLLLVLKSAIPGERELRCSTRWHPGTNLRLWLLPGELLSGFLVSRKDMHPSKNFRRGHDIIPI